MIATDYAPAEIEAMARTKMGEAWERREVFVNAALDNMTPELALEIKELANNPYLFVHFSPRKDVQLYMAWRDFLRGLRNIRRDTERSRKHLPDRPDEYWWEREDYRIARMRQVFKQQYCVDGDDLYTGEWIAFEVSEALKGGAA